jgi:hypothetical protein
MIGNGLFSRWAGCLLGLVLLLSAAGSVAFAQNSAMSQLQYIQWMANVCGEHLSGSGQDCINWARGKGMNPAGGWQLNAKLTKGVVSQTLVQLLNLAPRKGSFDASRILEREGILVTSDSSGYVGIKNMVVLVDGFSPRINQGNPDDENPDRNDDHRPTVTKPGNGYGDKNHDHSGPPGHSDSRPGKGNEKNGRD